MKPDPKELQGFGNRLFQVRGIRQTTSQAVQKIATIVRLDAERLLDAVAF
jgi:hypothetical protein